MALVEDVSAIRPITRRADASYVALAAYQQLLGLLDELSPSDWLTPTECAGWRVSDMVGHLVGAARANSSMRENLRQQIWGVRNRRRHSGNALDAVNALQITDHAGLSPEQLIVALRDVAPAAVKGRMRTPVPMRVITVPLAPGGSTATGMPRSVNLGHLADVIYTRDVWMHTIDIARAVNRPFDVAAPANRRIVADVVAEWVGRHGQPIDLVLTGPAGAHYRSGDPEGGAPMEHDAVEFCRILSGRAAGHDLLNTRLIF
jgi:uncharacterized protein (TIGR03083 family)